MYRDPAPREEEESVKKPWWKFWQCRKKVQPLTAADAAKLAEQRKREIHDLDVRECRGWMETKIQESLDRGWNGIIMNVDIKVSDEAMSIVTKDFEERGFHIRRSPKGKGIGISWTGPFCEKDQKNIDERDVK